MAPAKKAASADSAKKSARRKPAAGKADSPSTAVDAQLARYRSMRDFGITAEPSGTPDKIENGTKYPFCVQKHAASHLHYDFRLGWNGVLKSWAVAKGPSYVTADKRLAVQVEDHPMEYGGFEGIIPAGQYGGGTVMLWDQGTWEPQPEYPDVEAGLRSGSLKFILHGTKLHGKWALIRMGGKAANEKKPNWLLIKEHDDHERAPSAPAITDEAPDSVITGRTLDQIASSQDHVWNSKETAKPGQAWYAQPTKSQPAKKSVIPSGARSAQSKDPPPSMTPQISSRLSTDKTSTLPTESQPAFLPPQLAQQAETPPSASGWLHELKLDGYRIQARKSGAKVILLTRTGLDWTARMVSVADEVARLPVKSCTLDGEVVVLRADGTSSFADLQAAFQTTAPPNLTYFAFDLLHLEGRNPRDLPLIERKSLLATLLAAANSDHLRLSEHLDTDGPAMFQQACKLHAEGIVSKLASSKYAPGRTATWLKCKCLHEQEFVIAGYTLPSAGHTGMKGVGALLLGYYEGKKLIYAGRTGTGFTQKTHALLRAKLDALATPTQPFATIPAAAKRGAKWVHPKLVAQVRFATWTADNLVRQAAFLGLREDKPPAEVTRETSAPTPKSSTNRVPHDPRTHSEAKGEGILGTLTPSTPRAHNSPLPFRLTHPAKILDPTSHLTKQQLADYYLAIAPWLLHHIADRPLSLVRCPEGSAKPCFFQKHVNAMLPKGIGTVQVPDKKTGQLEPYITLTGPSATPEILASLAQLGVLELHPWGSRNADLEHPDRLIFDLDPDESLPWPAVTSAAADVRARLKKLGLTSFLKTTGGKGLHVVVPIQPTLDWPTTKAFAHAFVLALEKANPALYLTRMTKAARTGKIYLDYLRNERGATSVAPYSPRARADANVSMPLAWSELNTPARPTFPVADFALWKSRLRKDPWKSLASLSQTVTLEVLSAFGIKSNPPRHQ